MSQPAAKVPYRETNNHKQGKSGSGTMKKPGPAKGNRGVVNPTKSGGVMQSTRGRKS